MKIVVINGQTLKRAKKCFDPAATVQRSGGANDLRIFGQTEPLPTHITVLGMEQILAHSVFDDYRWSTSRVGLRDVIRQPATEKRNAIRLPYGASK